VTRRVRVQGSGFVLENFPKHVITAGHGLHDYNIGENLLFTAVRAWVTPVRGARAIPLAYQDQFSDDDLQRMGAIPCKAWSSLYPATVRRYILGNFRGRPLPGDEDLRDDIALLHLGDAYRDLKVPQPLQAWPAHLDVPADANGKMGVLLGNPSYPDLRQRIHWPAYKTWRSPSNEAHMTFPPRPAIQWVRGGCFKGMSGGPVVANLGNQKGTNLCLHMCTLKEVTVWQISSFRLYHQLFERF
jgi:hypothetical protein